MGLYPHFSAMEMSETFAEKFVLAGFFPAFTWYSKITSDGCRQIE
jgi:hypothetical protein